MLDSVCTSRQNENYGKIMLVRIRQLLVVSPLLSVPPGTAFAQQQGPSANPSTTTPSGSDPSSVATSLTNPVSSLISVPFQNNFDYRVGPNHDGFRYTMNFQPVIPVKLNDKVNLISRTILPVVYQTNAAVEGTRQAGLGDTTQSIFFSPASTKPFIWGIGPVLAIPTGTNGALGSRKFSIGPTVVALKQSHGVTAGALFFHVWSVAGSNSHSDVSLSFLQPFVAYTTKSAWTYLLNTESFYDGNAWNVPIHVQVNKLVKLGPQHTQIGGALRCWAASPANGPRDCGLRILVTLAYPKQQEPK